MQKRAAPAVSGGRPQLARERANGNDSGASATVKHHVVPEQWPRGPYATFFSTFANTLSFNHARRSAASLRFPVKTSPPSSDTGPMAA